MITKDISNELCTQVSLPFVHSDKENTRQLTIPPAGRKVNMYTKMALQIPRIPQIMKK